MAQPAHPSSQFVHASAAPNHPSTTASPPSVADITANTISWIKHLTTFIEAIERGGITAHEYLQNTERAGEVESFLQDVHNDLAVVPATHTACIEALSVGRAHVQELNLMVTEDTVRGLLPIISRGEHRTLLTLRKHMWQMGHRRVYELPECLVWFFSLLLDRAYVRRGEVLPGYTESGVGGMFTTVLSSVDPSPVPPPRPRGSSLTHTPNVVRMTGGSGMSSPARTTANTGSSPATLSSGGSRNSPSLRSPAVSGPHTPHRIAIPTTIHEESESTPSANRVVGNSRPRFAQSAPESPTASWMGNNYQQADSPTTSRMGNFQPQAEHGAPAGVSTEQQRRSEAFSSHVRVASNPDWWEGEIIRRGQATNQLFPPPHVCTFSQIQPEGGDPGDVLFCCVECFNSDGNFVRTPGLLLNIGITRVSTIYPSVTPTPAHATRPTSQQRHSSASDMYGSEDGSIEGEAGSIEGEDGSIEGEDGPHADQQVLRDDPPSGLSRLNLQGLCRIIADVFLTFFHGIKPMPDRP